jgi:hypothetical protein
MLKKMLFVLPVLLLVNLAICQLENLDDEAGMLKKTKVLACIAVSKARLLQDTVIRNIIKNL